MAPRFDRPRLYLDALGEQVSSLADLEAALKPRLRITSQRQARFLALDDAMLAAVAVTTQRAVDYLQRTLLSLGSDSARVDEVLKAIPRGFFCEDHAWRVLFDEFRPLSASYCEFKLLALARYRGYLVGCLNALKRVSDERLQATIGGGLGAVSEQKARPFTPGHAASRSRSTVTERDVVRLPHDVTVSIKPDLDGAVDLWLGRRRFCLETGSGVAFVDERGHSGALHEGRNVIGRGPVNDIVVDPGFRAVSRRHLIVDVRDAAPVALTDLSSHGTFVSRHSLGPYQLRGMLQPAPEDLTHPTRTSEEAVKLALGTRRSAR